MLFRSMLVSEQKNYDWANDIFLIILPPLERVTVFDNHKDTRAMAHTVDTATWKHEPYEVPSHRGLRSMSIREDMMSCKRACEGSICAVGKRITILEIWKSKAIGVLSIIVIGLPFIIEWLKERIFGVK